MAAAGKRRRRRRGNVEVLRSGALRVRVYAGLDPVSKRKLYLTETIPAGDTAQREAEKALTRLLNQVDERRAPRTSATLNQLLDRYLEVLDVAGGTRRDYISKVDKHIRPLLGSTPVGKIGTETLESLYADLRRCRDHCRGRKYVQHRTSRPHDCDEHGLAGPCKPANPQCRACRRMCRPHHCTPLGDSTIRAIHWILSGAFDRAVRWNWVSINPADLAEKPAMPRSKPKPPSVHEAARLADDAASRDPDWGTYVWASMTLGARRGEMCALRWSDIDLDNKVVAIERAISKDENSRWIEKDTKTHQQRRIVLDDDTTAALREHLARCQDRAATLDVELADNAYVFSLSPDGSTFLIPDSVSQRYDRMAFRLGIEATLHKLRHYSATELINAGVDVRVVAGRLGHGGGGATTLRVYTAWLSEADQRAAKRLSGRMPTRRPSGSTTDVASVDLETTQAPHRGPYMTIASDLRGAIACGALPSGQPLPTVKELAARYDVSVGTAHRALTLLSDDGLIQVSRGRRAIVA